MIRTVIIIVSLIAALYCILWYDAASGNPFVTENIKREVWYFLFDRKWILTTLPLLFLWVFIKIECSSILCKASFGFILTIVTIYVVYTIQVSNRFNNNPIYHEIKHDIKIGMSWKKAKAFLGEKYNYSVDNNGDIHIINKYVIIRKSKKETVLKIENILK